MRKQSVHRLDKPPLERPSGRKAGASVRHAQSTNGSELGAIPYDAFKKFGGKLYTGMKIGRSHKWYYDAGEWKETKVTPDQWQFTYSVTKRRAGRAPEGSGVPV